VNQGFVALAARPFADARDFAELGHDLLAAGMPALAIAPLRTAVARDPTFGDAHSFLGWALWQRGAPGQAEARQEIATGLKLAPRLSFADFAAGEVAFADGRPHDALALFRHGLSLDARNPALWAEAARAALALADYTTTEIALGDAAALSTDPAFSSAYVQFYLDHDIGFSDRRALTAATTAAARFPEDERIRFQLAEVYDLLLSPSNAYYSNQQALALDPTDPGPYLLLGRFAEDRGDLVAAALYLRTALALRPNGPLAGQARELLAPIAAIPV
jgi:Flp pilus assembly protein TadD